MARLHVAHQVFDQLEGRGGFAQALGVGVVRQKEVFGVGVGRIAAVAGQEDDQRVFGVRVCQPVGGVLERGFGDLRVGEHVGFDAREHFALHRLGDLGQVERVFVREGQIVGVVFVA